MKKKKKFYSLLLLFCISILALVSCKKETTPPSINLVDTETRISADAYAQHIEIKFSSTTEWTTRLTQTPDTDWISIDSQIGTGGEQINTIVVTMTKNEDTENTRRAYVNILYGGESQIITITQGVAPVYNSTPDYYFYATFGTMPTLYAGLHILSHNKPSYVFYLRSGTYVPSKFPDHATVLVPEDRIINASAQEQAQMSIDMKNRILAINNENPMSVFGLYVDDIRCRIGHDWFVKQGIDSARVKVTLLTDGSGTYNLFYNYFSSATSAQRNWDKYASEVEALGWNHKDSFQPHPNGDFNSYKWQYYLSTLPNYRYVMQNSSFLEASNAFMAEKINQMEIISEDPEVWLQRLPQQAKDQFYSMVKFDNEYYLELFNKSLKPNLVILGTSGNIQVQQRAYVTRIMDKYSDTHDVFFKPHPADLSSAGYESEFEGLTLLPGRMPFEVFAWSLMEQIEIIGGYQSTIFISFPIEKVKFIFDQANAAALPMPNNILFRDATHVDWMIPQ